MFQRILAGAPALGLALFALSACGGDDDDSGAATQAAGAAGTTAAATTNAASSPSGATAVATTPAAASPAGNTTQGAAGFVDVNGNRLAIDRVRRCEPFFGHEEDLDLTGIGQDVMVFVTINHPLSGSDLVNHDLSLQGGAAGGVFSAMAVSFDGTNWVMDEDNSPLPGPPFVVSGDRVTGSLELSDARGGPETRSVSFDLAIPDEIIADC